MIINTSGDQTISLDTLDPGHVKPFKRGVGSIGKGDLVDVPTPKNNTELERLIEHFKHVPPKGDEDAYGYYQNIAMNILQKGEETGSTSLLDILKEKPTPEQMRAIVLAIPFSVYQELPEVYQRISAILMEALEAENPRVIAEAVFGLNVLRQGDLAEHLKLLLEHSSPYVRQEVLRYLSVYYPDNGVPLNSLVECFKKDEPEGDVTYYLDAANLIRAQGRAGIDFLFDYYHRISQNHTKGIHSFGSQSSIT